MRELKMQIIALRGEISWHWYSWAANIVLPALALAVGYLWFCIL
jgi:hypothetical protein